MRRMWTGVVLGFCCALFLLMGQDAIAQESDAAAAIVEAAAEATGIDSGNTAWLLASSGLVLLMTPGLAFFYGGLVRKKNILSVLMQCFMAMCLVTVAWVVVGYSLAFGTDIKGLIGGFDYVMLKNVNGEPWPGTTVPHLVFMAFQLKFAMITPALIIGACAERMKFAAFCVFTVLWTLLVYSPMAHWVWGGGFIYEWGALDFAGGTVVHINAGMAALAAALVMGKRKGSASPPHSLPLAVLGAGMLWFGWFGFNAGSSLAADGIAANAMVATHIATAVAGLAWALVDWLYHGKPTTLGMITGVVAGLVAITPACGFVDAGGAIWIGLGSSLICWVFVTFIKPKLGYDDTLDAFGVHGVGGIWGALATGIFCSAAINPLVANAPWPQFIIQLKATLITMAFSFVASYILLKLVDWTIGLRVSEHEERVGLDLTQHKESGYTILD
ncbi:MAG TPA: ammonium transporter [Kiritimatiellia bacterium]|nr:ammonium transporter [Kiritimatiellia bacterium]